jgi:hypothetical protein
VVFPQVLLEVPVEAQAAIQVQLVALGTLQTSPSQGNNGGTLGREQILSGGGGGGGASAVGSNGSSEISGK